MNRNEFYSALSDYNDEHTLQHSSRPHKYLYITNTGRYVYEEPKKSRPYSTPNDYTSSNKKTPSNVGQKMANAISEQKRIDKKHGVDIDAINSDMKALNSMYSDFANNEDKMTNDNLAKLNEAIEALEEKINGIQNAGVLKTYRSYMDSLKGNLNRITDWAKRRGLLNDEIKHYGIKGQKWGVRHWQNADGTFNEAGKKRYFGKKNESELYSKAKKSGLESGDKYGYGIFDYKDAERLEKLNKLNKKGKLSYNSKEYDELERLRGKEYYSKHPDEYARDVESIENFKSDIDIIKDDGYKFDGPYDPDYGRKRITDEQYERMKSSTSLAYKADKRLSSNMDSNESFDNLDDDRQRSEMFWFAYEDQTIGMWRVADMINSGVPVNKVVRLIEDSNSFRSKGRLDIDILGTEGDRIRFDMLEGNYNDSLVNFAKECAKVKENKDEIKHYGTKGQKWGVRKYQNKDGSLTPAGREHYGYGDGDDDRSGDYSGANKSGSSPYKLGYFARKKAAKDLAVAFRNDDKEAVNRLKENLTGEDYDRAEEAADKYLNDKKVMKRAKQERDRKKAEYEENLKKDPEHTHKYKSQDMNTAESMSDEDAAKLKSIEDKMVQVAKTNGTSSKEYKDLDAQYGKTEKSIVDKMNKADGTDRYKSINSSYVNASKSGIKDFAKKSERKAAFDESTRVTGKEEAEAWKKLAAYYESQQKSGSKSSGKKPKYVDIDKNGNYIYKEDVEAHKRAEKAKKESDVDVNKVKKATYAGGLLGGFANLAWQKHKNKKG